MKGRLAVGLIGLGRLGRVYARDLAGRIPETRLVALSDPLGTLAALRKGASPKSPRRR